MHITNPLSSIPPQDSNAPFKPALIVVDVQNDFALPTGALSVPHGEEVIPPINALLTLPFALKLATRDWHPADHISFASNHAGATPYSTMATISNPQNRSETYESLLWPDHCVQHTPGAALHKDLDLRRIDRVLDKGTMPEVEMYSAFYPPLSNPRVGDSGLAALLRGQGITDVYVVGLAADYCVGATAEDAAREGFRSYIVEEGTRAVTGEQWERDKMKMGEVRRGVRLVHVDGPEVGRVREVVADGLKVLREVKEMGDRGLDVSSLPTAK